MRKIDESKSILTLNKTYISQLYFERFSDTVDKIDEEGEITFSKQIQEIQKNVYKVELSVVLKSEGVYDIKSSIVGEFGLSEDAVLGKKLLYNNTIAILFPYLRSQLTLLTSQPGFEPVILPVMNINALMTDEE
jgi:preprotein translocase subunit SecB